MINEETMQKMNAKVDNEGMMVEQVAHDFLVETGLIKRNDYTGNAPFVETRGAFFYDSICALLSSYIH